MEEKKEIKTETMYFTDKKEEVIEEFKNPKDLGVHVNSQPNFKTNVANVAKKARQKMGWIMRSFHSKTMMFMKQMFNTLVNPHIDYNLQLYIVA